jgi:putative membrane protein
MTIIWTVVVVAIVLLVMWLVERGRAGGPVPEKEEGAVDLLKKRYAKGEIDKEEFEQKKKDLTDS